MKIIKTREEAAELLAAAANADFPLAFKQSADGLFIAGAQGRALCRYDYAEPHLDDEIIRLQKIIARLNAIHAAGENALLRSDAEQAALWQKSVRRAWAAKLKSKEKGAAVIYKGKVPHWAVVNDGPKMKESTVLDKAVKAGLGDELALALFARMVKAGIMPLAFVTFGQKDYDLRYRADEAKLAEFLAAQPETLLPQLSPAGEGGEMAEAVFPADWPIVQDSPPMAEKAAQPAPDIVIAPKAEAAPHDETISRLGTGQNKGHGGGFDEDAAAPLVPPKQQAGSNHILPFPPSLPADDDDDTEIFAEPTAPHALGTMKHKAVADKLCDNLSVVWPFGTAGKIYKFKNTIDFTVSERFPWGQFKEDEVSYLNQALSDLQKATSILVEYRLPPKPGTAERPKRIDVVAYYAESKTLKIIDWKFGRNPVPVDNNPQLNGYVRRLLADFIGADNGDKVKWIEISIVQPNSYVGETKRRFLNKGGCLA